MRTQINTIKNAIRHKYAWPGGYTLFSVTSDGAALCIPCMKKEFRSILWSLKNNVSDGWKVSSIHASCELESNEYINENIDEHSHTYCDHCNVILND